MGRIIDCNCSEVIVKLVIWNVKMIAQTIFIEEQGFQVKSLDFHPNSTFPRARGFFTPL